MPDTFYQTAGGSRWQEEIVQGILSRNRTIIEVCPDASGSNLLLMQVFEKQNAPKFDMYISFCQPGSAKQATEPRHHHDEDGNEDFPQRVEGIRLGDNVMIVYRPFLSKGLNGRCANIVYCGSPLSTFMAGEERQKEFLKKSFATGDRVLVLVILADDLGSEKGISLGDLAKEEGIPLGSVTKFMPLSYYKHLASESKFALTRHMEGYPFRFESVEVKTRWLLFERIGSATFFG